MYKNSYPVIKQFIILSDNFFCSEYFNYWHFAKPNYVLLPIVDNTFNLGILPVMEYVYSVYFYSSKGS